MRPKTTAITLLFFITGIASNAQLKKGMRMVGVSIGNIYFNSGETDYSDPNIPGFYTSNNDNFGFSFSPSYGWFITDNTAIGALISFNYRHQKVFDVSNGITFRRNTSNFFDIGIGGFARNYFSSSGNWMPFGQFSTDFGLGSSNHEGFSFSGNDKSTFDGKSAGDFFANAGLSAGLTKMLNANTGLEIFIGYNFSYSKSTYRTTTLVDQGNDGTIDQTGTSEPTSRYTNHGFAAGIGFQIFLDPKK
jgi:hypothetical protein